ncbi:MAG: beta-ketoacyl-ACP synthase II [Rhodospirillaceae bacterium]|nr:beta-ketoacyl-ACP synthase II [Rhodospirillaceae bacterium]MBT6086813.1 beta-ketoacyl-ACP synthase II [Rhodospirillaceae bacterium]MBT6608402.1 beta-ketoacyl-ACP synthase II [Rhodospirillaceae bacterium]MBT7509137.1 beta-ketoacyl-ACP synthase II [Rhodospirillaceae bacterium]
MRRVVITGMGMVTSLGIGVDRNWAGLLAGKSGIRAIENFDVSDLPAKIAGQVPEGPTEDGLFFSDDWVSPKDRRRMDDFIVYGLCAAKQAIEDSGWVVETEEQAWRTGVLIGSGIGGLPEIAGGAIKVNEGKARRLSPFFIPASLINLISGHVSIRWGFKGPNHAVVTACSTGSHAIGDAARLIMWEDADVMVAGGAEAAVCDIGVAGFCAARALSTDFNDTPEKASRPWDKDRDGFVMGDGAGVVVLEELEHAKKRGAKIYGEVVGYGMSGDAHHITAPVENGDGAFRCMNSALKRAGMNVEEIDYVNAHGTSTPLGDEIELGAVKRVFGDHAYNISMSSTKSAIGHLLGAAGAVEAIFSLQAINNGVAPPTLNLDNPSESCDIDLVPHQPKERLIRAVLSNSFGFGGTNASLIFKALDS